MIYLPLRSYYRFTGEMPDFTYDHVNGRWTDERKSRYVNGSWTWYTERPIPLTYVPTTPTKTVRQIRKFVKTSPFYESERNTHWQEGRLDDVLIDELYTDGETIKKCRLGARGRENIVEPIDVTQYAKDIYDYRERIGGLFVNLRCTFSYNYIYPDTDYYPTNPFVPITENRCMHFDIDLGLATTIPTGHIVLLDLGLHTNDDGSMTVRDNVNGLIIHPGVESMTQITLERMQKYVDENIPIFEEELLTQVSYANRNRALQQVLVPLCENLHKIV